MEATGNSISPVYLANGFAHTITHAMEAIKQLSPKPQQTPIWQY